MLSVDRGYDVGDRVSKRTRKREKKIYKKLKLDWSNVRVPGGWTGVIDQFNLDGYGLTLVDADGIVRGVNIHSKQLKKLMKQLYPNAPKRKKAPAKSSSKTD